MATIMGIKTAGSRHRALRASCFLNRLDSLKKASLDWCQALAKYFVKSAYLLAG